MKFRTIIICAIAVAALTGAGAIALAPSAAEEDWYPALECGPGEVLVWANTAGQSCNFDNPNIDLGPSEPLPVPVVPIPVVPAPAAAPVPPTEPIVVEAETAPNCG